MNILFVANRFPYPPYRGDKLKIFNLAKQLSKRHNLFLITFIQDKNDYKYINELKNYFDEIRVVYLPKYKSILNCLFNFFSSSPLQIKYFQTGEFQEMLNRFINENNIDVIHTQHLRMSQYTYNLPGIKRILDLPDAYSLYWERRSKLKCHFLKKIFDRFEYKKVLKYEEIIKHFDMTLVCSEEDKTILKKKHESNKIRILPNGVDLSTFHSHTHDYGIDNKIIFTGNMDYYPNVDAAVYFVKEIFPHIADKFPNVKFYISGQNPVKKILELQSEKVIVTGFVESIADEYRNSSIAVSPIRVGAGTLNKVLEPIAMGVPVVSTPIGFEGLGIQSGEGVILAKDKKEFIDSLSELLANSEYRKKVGELGKIIAGENFGWNKIAQQLEKYFYILTEPALHTKQFKKAI
ncbi:MAG: glycosyltransferase [Bacteroidota bacterium]|nr:glycosyltransferase [Bacteroidota bacterium]